MRRIFYDQLSNVTAVLSDFRSFNSRFIHRFESKRQEIEAWLVKMESKSERMGKAAAQVDGLDFTVLDTQQKEQKVKYLPISSSVMNS